MLKKNSKEQKLENQMLEVYQVKKDLEIKDWIIGYLLKKNIKSQIKF